MSMSDQVGGFNGGTDQAKSRVNDAASKSQRMASEFIHDSKDRINRALDGAGVNMDRAQDFVAKQMNERPMASVGVALGIGVLLGAMLSSRR